MTTSRQRFGSEAEREQTVYKLQQVKELVEYGWCQNSSVKVGGVAYLSPGGTTFMDALSFKAGGQQVCWCLTGALNTAVDMMPLVKGAPDYGPSYPTARVSLDKAIKEWMEKHEGEQTEIGPYPSMVAWNDYSKRTQVEVTTLLDMAIAVAQAGEIDPTVTRAFR